MEDIIIETASINLDQFLKWAAAVESGGQVKPLIEEGLIAVNGTVVNERRKKLYSGDIVTIKGSGSWKVVGPCR